MPKGNAVKYIATAGLDPRSTETVSRIFAGSVQLIPVQTEIPLRYSTQYGPPVALLADVSYRPTFPLLHAVRAQFPNTLRLLLIPGETALSQIIEFHHSGLSHAVLHKPLAEKEVLAAIREFLVKATASAAIGRCA